MEVKKNISSPKKITVRFFLQKKVQGTASRPDENGKSVPLYPVYIYITYNRKNMQFKSRYTWFYADIKEVEINIMDFEEKLITQLIRYETSFLSNGKEYDMKGLNDKYKIYSTSIESAIETYLQPKLRLAILRTNNKLQHSLNLQVNSYNTILLLYEAARKLFDNFYHLSDKVLHEEIETYKKVIEVLHSTKYNSPTVLDWLDGSYKNELNLILVERFNNKTEIISGIFNLIDGAVAEQIKKIEKINQKYHK